LTDGLASWAFGDLAFTFQASQRTDLIESIAIRSADEDLAKKSGTGFRPAGIHL